MDEYISREAVINITAETGALETQNRVRELPAADVQPVKHGRWIYSDIPIFGNPYGRYCCSLCGSAMDSGEDNYCPCCGANMKGDVEIARIDK